MAPQSKFNDFKDELGEIFVEAGQAVKKQIAVKTPPPIPPEEQIQDQKNNNKIDPTTGKPIPSKKMLGNLTQQVAQLSQMRLKKVREELEKQRLKMGQPDSAKASPGEGGPEIKHEEKKPQDNAVAKTLAASKSTGEMKGTIGG